MTEPSEGWPWVLPDVPTVFLRHGESTANREDTVAGSRDVALTARGRAAAAAARDRLRGLGLAVIYTSPLARARETAAIVNAVLHLPVETVETLAERKWGEWEGRPRAGLDRAGIPPGGEGPAVFARRTLDGLAALDWRTPALLVAHAGTFRVLAAHLGLENPEGRIGNCTPIRLDPPSGDGRRWTMRTL